MWREKPKPAIDSQSLWRAGTGGLRPCRAMPALDGSDGSLVSGYTIPRCRCNSQHIRRRHLLYCLLCPQNMTKMTWNPKISTLDMYKCALAMHIPHPPPLYKFNGFTRLKKVTYTVSACVGGWPGSTLHGPKTRPLRHLSISHQHRQLKPNALAARIAIWEQAHIKCDQFVTNRVLHRLQSSSSTVGDVK